MAYTTINKGSSYFNTVLYTGNGTSQSITGVGFQPDMVWGKIRDTTRKHNIYDVIRGVQQRIVPNDTAAEDTVPGVTAFNSDGFSVGSETDMNQNGNTFVGWSWKANGAGVSNTAGTITSTVSANQTAGFSIVAYTGNGSGTATIGHGLGITPSCVIMRPRSYIGAWWITHKNLSTDNVLEFNTNAEVSYSSFGGGGLRQSQYTSSIITGGNGISNSNLWNNSGSTYIAYCFAEVKGYSKFGSYTGNGSADGTFVYTGFKPSFVLTKSSSDSGASYNWQVWDNKRNPYNAVDEQLRPNTNESQNADVAYSMDFVSNGFKMRGTNTNQNGSGSTYIYMAFAENPFVTSTQIPTTAR